MLIPVGRPVTREEGLVLASTSDWHTGGEIPVPEFGEDGLYGARSSRWEVAAAVRRVCGPVGVVDVYEYEQACVANSIDRQERAWEATQRTEGTMETCYLDAWRLK